MSAVPSSPTATPPPRPRAPPLPKFIPMAQLYQHEHRASGAACVPAEEFIPEHVLQALEELMANEPYPSHRESSNRDYQHGTQYGETAAAVTRSAAAAVPPAAGAADADDYRGAAEDREAREERKEVTFR